MKLSMAHACLIALALAVTAALPSCKGGKAEPAASDERPSSVPVVSLSDGTICHLKFETVPKASVPLSAILISDEGNSLKMGKVKDLKVEFLMPQHNHGTNSAPAIRRDGDTVTISDLVLHMPGEWELRIEYSTGVDSYRASGFFKVM